MRPLPVSGLGQPRDVLVRALMNLMSLLFQLLSRKWPGEIVPRLRDIEGHPLPSCLKGQSEKAVQPSAC